MTYVLCPECGEVCELDGPDGLLVHLIAFHPNTEPAMFVMRELATMPLPEVVR